MVLYSSLCNRNCVNPAGHLFYALFFRLSLLDDDGVTASLSCVLLLGVLLPFWRSNAQEFTRQPPARYAQRFLRAFQY